MLFLNSRSLASVSYAAVDFFRPSAQRLIEEKGAVDALAAALAHISGASSFEPRSLITSDKVEICKKMYVFEKRLKLNHSYLFVWKEIQEIFTLHNTLLTETYTPKPVYFLNCHGTMQVEK